MRIRSTIVFIAVSFFVATNVFASRATNLVHGTGDAGAILGINGDNGSLGFNDSYNIFYNPAYVNDYKNWGIIEKSNGPVNNSGAEGGFVANFMNFNFGFYMNRISGVELFPVSNKSIESYGTYGNTTTAIIRPFDVMVGADMGVKWGLGATVAGQKQGGNSDSHVMLRGGGEVMDIEPFIAVQVAGNDQNSVPGTTIHNKAFEIGTRYHWGEWTPYAAYITTGNDQSGTDLNYYRGFGAGIARSAKIAEGVKMNYAVGYWSKRAIPSSAYERVVPIDFSIEGDAAAWLTLRAGLTYNIYDRIDDATQSNPASGRFGATIRVGKVDAEFVMGKAAGDWEIMDSKTLDVSNGFFTAASLGYHW